MRNYPWHGIRWLMGSALCLFLLSSCSQAGEGEKQPRGTWTVTVLDSRHVVLTGYYGAFYHEEFKQHYRQRLQHFIGRHLPKWASEYQFNISGTEVIAAYRPRLAKSLSAQGAVSVRRGGENLTVQSQGYWLNPIGQARFPDEDRGVEVLTPNGDVAHYVFLTLKERLAPGDQLTFHLPTGESIDWNYGEQVRSLLFKVNQVGYMPEAEEKYAYMGAWQGTGGPLPMADYAGKPFRLVRETDGQVVFTGTTRVRLHDEVSSGGAPFSGEEVLELDFSRVRHPGRYYLEVDGVGRSLSFGIGHECLARAFYVHARGLYHKRCGMAKERPYTRWVCPACHQDVIRGNFPPHQRHYWKGDREREYGFFTAAGESLELRHFRLIEENVPKNPEHLQLCGGWHDAADYDRRPYHMRIVGDLCGVFLLRPENFCDGQLDLPESGNGIPDILDEASWGLRHLRLGQQKDGGVGTWIETVRHPVAGEGLPHEEKRAYYLSRATLNSSLHYAAYASMLALALRQAGAQQEASLYAESARRAWNYALEPANGRTSTYRYNHRTVFYREDLSLSGEHLVKAGYNLSLLFDDLAYLEPALSRQQEILACMKRQSWSWSPLSWIELEVFTKSRQWLEFEPFRRARYRDIVKDAQRLLRQIDGAHQYRLPWFSQDEGWVHTMSWGTYHPLRRALTLIAAHGITGEKCYLNGAYVANDFHNGANPNGICMTSGLGQIYPVRFLDLVSYADGIGEFVPGITPYRNTYGINPEDAEMAHGLVSRTRKDMLFPGLNQGFPPCNGKNPQETRAYLSKHWPIWRRWTNLEAYTVAASEYSVWETIGPAAATTGYLLKGSFRPPSEWRDRQPVADERTMPGFAPLP